MRGVDEGMIIVIVTRWRNIRAWSGIKKKRKKIYTVIELTVYMRGFPAKWIKKKKKRKKVLVKNGSLLGRGKQVETNNGVGVWCAALRSPGTPRGDSNEANERCRVINAPGLGPTHAYHTPLINFSPPQCAFQAIFFIFFFYTHSLARKFIYFARALDVI